MSVQGASVAGRQGGGAGRGLAVLRGKVWETQFRGIHQPLWVPHTSPCFLRPPLPLCSALDEGTNPDTFTVQVFRDSLAANQARWVLRRQQCERH